MEFKDNWTVVQTNQLIAVYKKFSNLWDINHRYYKCKELRRACVKAVAKELQSVRPGTTTHDIRGKIKTLRAQYGKEKRRKELHIARRIPGEFIPKLWCYDDIKYIDLEIEPNHKSQYIGLDDLSSEDIVGESMIAEFLEDEPVKNNVVEVRQKRRPPRLSNWTKEQTIFLLQLIRKRPMIFDNTHPYYANFCQRAKAFHEIRHFLRAKKPEVTIPEIRSKLKTLRSQYLKEKRLIAQSIERNDRKTYVPKLWCFKYCQFLDDRGKFLEEEREAEVKTNEVENYQDVQQPDDCYVMENENEIYVKSFDEVDTVEEVDTGMSHTMMECHDVSDEQKFNRSVLYQKCLDLVESLTTQISPNEEDNESANTPQCLLGKMVEIELSKVSEEIYEDTKWKIIRLLEEATKKDKAIKLNGCEYN